EATGQSGATPTRVEQTRSGRGAELGLGGLPLREARRTVLVHALLGEVDAVEVARLVARRAPGRQPELELGGGRLVPKVHHRFLRLLPTEQAHRPASPDRYLARESVGRTTSPKASTFCVSISAERD